VADGVDHHAHLQPGGLAARDDRERARPGLSAHRIPRLRRRLEGRHAQAPGELRRPAALGVASERGGDAHGERGVRPGKGRSRRRHQLRRSAPPGRGAPAGRVLARASRRGGRLSGLGDDRRAAPLRLRRAHAGLRPRLDAERHQLGARARHLLSPRRARAHRRPRSFARVLRRHGVLAAPRRRRPDRAPAARPRDAPGARRVGLALPARRALRARVGARLQAGAGPAGAAAGGRAPAPAQPFLGPLPGRSHLLRPQLAHCGEPFRARGLAWRPGDRRSGRPQRPAAAAQAARGRDARDHARLCGPVRARAAPQAGSRRRGERAGAGRRALRRLDPLCAACLVRPGGRLRAPARRPAERALCAGAPPAAARQKRRFHRAPAREAPRPSARARVAARAPVLADCRAEHRARGAAARGGDRARAPRRAHRDDHRLQRRHRRPSSGLHRLAHPRLPPRALFLRRLHRAVVGRAATAPRGGGDRAGDRAGRRRAPLAEREDARRAAPALRPRLGGGAQSGAARDAAAGGGGSGRGVPPRLHRRGLPPQLRRAAHGAEGDRDAFGRGGQAGPASRLQRPARGGHGAPGIGRPALRPASAPAHRRGAARAARRRPDADSLQLHARGARPGRALRHRKAGRLPACGPADPRALPAPVVPRRVPGMP